VVILSVLRAEERLADAQASVADEVEQALLVVVERRPAREPREDVSAVRPEGQRSYQTIELAARIVQHVRNLAHAVRPSRDGARLVQAACTCG